MTQDLTPVVNKPEPELLHHGRAEYGQQILASLVQESEAALPTSEGGEP